MGRKPDYELEKEGAKIFKAMSELFKVEDLLIRALDKLIQVTPGVLKMIPGFVERLSSLVEDFGNLTRSKVEAVSDGEIDESELKDFGYEESADEELDKKGIDSVGPSGDNAEENFGMENYGKNSNFDEQDLETTATNKARKIA